MVALEEKDKQIDELTQRNSQLEKELAFANTKVAQLKDYIRETSTAGLDLVKEDRAPDWKERLTVYLNQVSKDENSKEVPHHGGGVHQHET